MACLAGAPQASIAPRRCVTSLQALQTSLCWPCAILHVCVALAPQLVALIHWIASPRACK